MTATQSLAVVKQIQALAEGPETPEMRSQLAPVVKSLQFFLEHPDSRVRSLAAKTLSRLSRNYGEDMRKLDLGKTRAAVERFAKDAADGDSEAEELRQCLLDALGQEKEEKTESNGTASTAGAGETPASSSSADDSQSRGSPSKGGERGEVVLVVPEGSPAKSKGLVLEAVVVIPGVVSIAFEGDNAIVSTRTPEVAADSAFQQQLVAAIEAQGLHGVKLAGGDGPSVEAPGDEDDVEPAYLDDEEDDEDAPGGATSNTTGMPLGASAVPGTPHPHWSFFSQTNWMTGRRVQEFDDDPTIAARLAKAKKREEERKAEEAAQRGRAGRFISSLFGGGR
eukprot:gnl/TRDRNA2_/TRDRNA2_165410_c3_seq1.p1 gnl/TRDRNA2_/TRDRNA2_165410_c3~~gnl/TRDRNA2_/TRDRNA2_165410_c3_seq1.p1  ORF type:complete len:357 (+),score=85.06 gnl/TRDRNA2_/TRDRNA2_165410_c3_seq1:63-1073(+)